MTQKTKKAEKCGICFFTDRKKAPIFLPIKTTDQKFNNEIQELILGKMLQG